MLRVGFIGLAVVVIAVSGGKDMDFFNNFGDFREFFRQEMPCPFSPWCFPPMKQQDPPGGFYKKQNGFSNFGNFRDFYRQGIPCPVGEWCFPPSMKQEDPPGGFFKRQNGFGAFSEFGNFRDFYF